MKKTAIALLLLAATPAAAKIRYSSYEGPDAVQAGKGGAKTDMKGIDLWTSGTPARRFQVLGFIEDQRKDRLLDGDPTNSPAVAKQARAVGGDALILIGQDSQAVGVLGTANIWGSGNSAFGTATGRVVNRRITRFAVIKYLPE